MPVSETDCGLVASESVNVSVPLRVPVAVGEKVTETLQLAPAASEVPQVFVCAKSPLAAMELMLTVLAVPLFKVTDFDVEVVPTVCDAKVKLLGEMEKEPVAAPTVMLIVDLKVVPALSLA